jgi:hemoglobin
MAEIETHTLYELAGGKPAFVGLVDNFYDRIADDPLLRPLFPADFRDPKERLALFLVQYFGGPATYSEQRGHPRLRMRHLPFRIGHAERDAWLGHMLAALADSDIPEAARGPMRTYFADASAFMMNVAE